MPNPVPVTLTGVNVQYWPQQSPIDLTAAIGVKFPKDYLRFDYPAKVVGNFQKDAPPDDHGFNLVLKPDSEAVVTLDGSRARLKKLHFHHQSEHLVHGKRFPLEVHLVHEFENPQQGSTHLVIGVFVDDTAGKKTPASFRSLADFLTLPTVQDHLTKVANRYLSDPPTNDIEFDPNHFLPKKREFFRYEGSLTTAPFSETVSWLVFEHPIKIAGDIENIKKYSDHEARQPQEAARRFVLHSE